jgi:hypothetical protein
MNKAVGGFLWGAQIGVWLGWLYFFIRTTYPAAISAIFQRICGINALRFCLHFQFPLGWIFAKAYQDANPEFDPEFGQAW